MQAELEIYPSPKSAVSLNHITFSITPIIIDGVAMIVSDSFQRDYLDKIIEDINIYEIIFEVSLN
jgi:hypothetical protein